MTREADLGERVPEGAVRSDKRVRCYLCLDQRPESETEVTRYRVKSRTPGGAVSGVNRYVRMCRVGFGCKA